MNYEVTGSQTRETDFGGGGGRVGSGHCCVFGGDFL